MCIRDSLCPFHGEKTASFSVSPQRQIYKCFGCGVGGGVLNFIMEIEGMEFINAVKYLADQYSIELQIDETPGQSKDLIIQLFDIHEKTAFKVASLLKENYFTTPHPIRKKLAQIGRELISSTLIGLSDVTIGP